MMNDNFFKNRYDLAVIASAVGLAAGLITYRVAMRALTDRYVLKLGTLDELPTQDEIDEHEEKLQQFLCQS